MGDYSLTALATDTAGNSATSAVVSVAVAGPIAQIGVFPDSAAVATGGTQQFAATARDVLGHALSPQPAFSWSVSGGGTMGSNGLFTAGGSVAAPFTIFATTGGFTGIAGVSVVSGGGGTLGNSNDGTASDTMWSGGAWINACRFQASSDLAASTVHAKVGAVPGRYKCGIYADSGGRPDAFFGGSADIANPADGWTVFTLTSPLALAGGQYYWLAIWSNDANARVYYSDTGGTLQWGQYRLWRMARPAGDNRRGGL